MPIPKRIVVEQLHPPPAPPEKVIEKYDFKIFIYLTESLYQKYELLKGDMTWSAFGRKLLKEYDEGSGHKTNPDITSFVAEALKIFKGFMFSIPPQQRQKESEEEWELAKQKAKDKIKAVAQTTDHKSFMSECVPELKDMFGRADGIEDWNEKYIKMGLEDVETHECPKADDMAFNNFLKEAEVRKASFADCKWKQQVKEVKVNG